MNIQELLWPPLKQSTIVDQHGQKTQYFFNWLNALYNVIIGTLGKGIGTSTPVTVTLAKLTTGGANGSLTLTNGVITAYVAPT
jgi:hypothetical protein